jgi:hypothetical protein
MSPEQIEKINRILGKIEDMNDWCEDDTVQQCLGEIEDDLVAVIGQNSFAPIKTPFECLDSYEG